jgi:hypothetical protein
MVERGSVCLRRLAGGWRAAEVRFGRFLAHRKVTLERLIAGWSERTVVAAAGRRHVLAIQDTTELCFRTSEQRRRGLGEIGKGGGRGALLHAMLALDAESGSCLGLVGGTIWTRHGGRVTVPHEKRPLAARESHRWLTTAATARQVLAGAAMVTVVADRESDIYDEWGRLPAPAAGFHLLTRVMHDHCLADGGSLSAASERFAVAGHAVIELPASLPKRPVARSAALTLRFGPVVLRRPKRSLRDLPASVPLMLVEVVEEHPPPAVEPVHWRLLTTHAIGDAAAAWRLVGWYKMRWVIEQLFRILKTQGLRIEDSQLDEADGLLKLAAVATQAAAITLQLVQARAPAPAPAPAPARADPKPETRAAGGESADESAAVSFSAPQIAALEALDHRLAGRTRLQQNPHPRHSLGWAAWIIARLGGWDGYPSSRPPGPITFKHGLDYFQAFAAGWTVRDLCIP